MDVAAKLMKKLMFYWSKALTTQQASVIKGLLSNLCISCLHCNCLLIIFYVTDDDEKKKQT